MQDSTAEQTTLYLKNLNEKINIKELGKVLESLYAPLGDVLEVRLSKNIRMRGQAFVVFRTHEQAAQAMEKTKNFYVFGKPLVIKFAKSKSDALAKEDGTLEENKRKRVESQQERATKFKAVAAKAERNSRVKMATMQAGYGGFVPMAGEELEPNKILFVQNVPAAATQVDIANAFCAYPGFVEVRMVPGKRDIAFVEFMDEYQAGIAKESLHGFQLVPERASIKVNFAKK